MKQTSKAIRELLKRKGIKPTGCAEQDMALAKSVMPVNYKDRSTQTVTWQIESYNNRIKSLEKSEIDTAEINYYEQERLIDALVESNAECERLRDLAMIATVLAVVEFIFIGLMVL